MGGRRAKEIGRAVAARLTLQRGGRENGRRPEKNNKLLCAGSQAGVRSPASVGPGRPNMSIVSILLLTYGAAVAGFLLGLIWSSAVKENYRRETEELQQVLATLTPGQYSPVRRS